MSRGIILKNGWTKQPQQPVALDPYYWDKAVCGWTHANRNIDIVDGATYSGTILPNAIARDSIGQSIASSSSFLYRTIADVGSASPLTLLIVGRSLNTTQTGAWGGVGNGAAASNGYLGLFGAASGSVIRAVAADSDSVYYNSNSTTPVNSVAVSGFSSALQLSLEDAAQSIWFIDGVIQPTPTHSGGKTSGYTYDRFAVGGIRRSTSISGVNGVVTLAALWAGRIFTDAELKSLSENPWQIFRPIQRRIYVPSAGTGTNTYTYNGSGTVTLSGASAVARWRSYAGSGTVTLSGAAAVARWRSYAGAGTVTMSGAATTALVPAGTTTYTYSGSGTVTLSGAAAVARWRAWAGSGTVTLSGAATTALVPGLVVYTYAGSGTITLSGAATTTGPVKASRPSAGAGKSKGKRARARILRDEQLTAEDRRRLGVPEPVEAEPEADRAPAPKRAKRAGKASRGIQLAQEPTTAEQFRAAEILAQRTAELMAQQQAAQDAMRAEGMAMLQAAAAIEADNELMMLLLMAA